MNYKRNTRFVDPYLFKTAFPWKDACYIERFNECAELIAQVLDAAFDTDTQDMTLINQLIEKHIERKNHE